MSYLDFIKATCARLGKVRVQDNPIQDRAELIGKLTELGEHQRSIAKLEAEMNDEIAEIVERYTVKAEPAMLTIKRLGVLATEYCDLHRAELLADTDGKTVNLGVAEVSYIKNADRLSYEVDEYTAIQELREKGLIEYVRTNEEISKQAVKDNWETLKTKLTQIRIAQGKERVQITIAGVELPK